MVAEALNEGMRVKCNRPWLGNALFRPERPKVMPGDANFRQEDILFYLLVGMQSRVCVCASFLSLPCKTVP